MIIFFVLPVILVSTGIFIWIKKQERLDPKHNLEYYLDEKNNSHYFIQTFGVIISGYGTGNEFYALLNIYKKLLMGISTSLVAENPLGQCVFMLCLFQLLFFINLYFHSKELLQLNFIFDLCYQIIQSIICYILIYYWSQSLTTPEAAGYALIILQLILIALGVIKGFYFFAKNTQVVASKFAKEDAKKIEMIETSRSQNLFST
eukprot:c20878_g1_i3.p1 GENE.c20878_g1_i3~~c20878_g1_i3.p1  ORF type:complete len:204 (+),score=50.31 c20878_g1_i3:148-759(+)